MKMKNMEKELPKPTVAVRPLSFKEKEESCKSVFKDLLDRYGEIWHLCTPGQKQPIIFKEKSDYEIGMRVIGMCALDCPTIRIITFELMSNHIHFIICGEADSVNDFFSLVKRRLTYFFKSEGRPVNLTEFKPNLIPIKDLESIRNQIVYTNRNNYLVDDSQTPFSYPYGANGFYFMDFAKKLYNTEYGLLTIRQRKEFTKSHDYDYPMDTKIIDNYFSPASYCLISEGERLFRDARHYFYKLSKDIESTKDIALLNGDTILYTDDELVSLTWHICRKDYGGIAPTLLSPENKIILAKTLHYDYYASNARISRLLKMPLEMVSSMFPLKTK